MKSKAYVGGKGIDNTGGKLIDFLFANKLTRNISLIEIKVPTTHLLESQYRNGVYRISSEMVDSLGQVRSYKNSLEKNYKSLVNDSAIHFEAFNPRCIVVLGNIQREVENNKEKKETFELFRSGNTDIEIVTYDELFEKIKILVELLEGK